MPSDQENRFCKGREKAGNEEERGEGGETGALTYVGRPDLESEACVLTTWAVLGGGSTAPVSTWLQFAVEEMPVSGHLGMFVSPKHSRGSALSPCPVTRDVPRGLEFVFMGKNP